LAVSGKGWNAESSRQYAIDRREGMPARYSGTSASIMRGRRAKAIFDFINIFLAKQLRGIDFLCWLPKYQQAN